MELGWGSKSGGCQNHRKSVKIGHFSLKSVIFDEFGGRSISTYISIWRYGEGIGYRGI